MIRPMTARDVDYGKPSLVFGAWRVMPVSGPGSYYRGARKPQVASAYTGLVYYSVVWCRVGL